MIEKIKKILYRDFYVDLPEWQLKYIEEEINSKTQAESKDSVV